MTQHVRWNVRQVSNVTYQLIIKDELCVMKPPHNITYKLLDYICKICTTSWNRRKVAHKLWFMSWYAETVWQMEVHLHPVSHEMGFVRLSIAWENQMQFTHILGNVKAMRLLWRQNDSATYILMNIGWKERTLLDESDIHLLLAMGCDILADI